MKRLLLYLFPFLLLTSCEDQTDWPLQLEQTNFVVVSGLITDELKPQQIVLQKPLSGLNAAPEPVSGATVLVTTDERVYRFSEDKNSPGTYISDTAFAGIARKTYSLNITSGGDVYSAKAMLPASLDFPMLTLLADPSGELLRISKVAASYSSNDPAMYEILLDWSALPAYAGIPAESCRAEVYYYTLPTLDVSEVFAPASEKVSFPKGTLITERRYSLTAEHAAFLRALLLETTWQGGFFNTASANVPTNMSSGARGFFGACGVKEKTGVAE
jgi:hypothetical protein